MVAFAKISVINFKCKKKKDIGGDNTAGKFLIRWNIFKPYIWSVTVQSILLLTLKFTCYSGPLLHIASAGLLVHIPIAMYAF